jgi:PAS domain S-box-containing protein
MLISKLNKVNWTRKLPDLEIFDFFQAINQVDDAVFITDSKGIIRYVNPAFEKMTGYSDNEVIGNRPKLFKSGKHKKSFYKRLWETISRGETFRERVTNRKKSGELLYTDHTITPIRGTDGQISFYIGIWKDISNQIISDHRKDEFINIAAHEFKNPITTIKALNQILLNRFKRDTMAMSYLQSMEDQVRRLTIMVNDLLDMSRIQKGKVILRKERFSLQELINQAVENYQLTLPQYQVITQGKCFDTIWADRTKIGQVVNNLVTNAAKYSPEGSRIWITTTKKDKEIEVRIRDEGEGVPLELQKKIFEKYFRIDNQTTKKRNGLGIGLYISSQIVRLHGGKIGLKSQPSKGSTFFFSLPLIDKD